MKLIITGAVVTQWEKVKNKKGGPEGSFYHTTITSVGDMAIVFGGRDADNHYHDKLFSCTVYLLLMDSFLLIKSCSTIIHFILSFKRTLPIDDTLFC
jgi:hypothetical protein